MEKKTNIRSIRFSDTVKEVIEAQQGETFTEKFENLIQRCMWELPRKEQEIKYLEVQIERDRKQLREMANQVREMQSTIYELRPKMATLSAGIDRAIEKWAQEP